MSDAGGEDAEYTETEHEDLGDRLQGACAGVCIGALLFLGSFPLLFWNEARAVDRYDALEEAETQTTSIDPTFVDPANEGKLLHFTANITNGGDDLVDPVFGIESDGLTLRRGTEMYQWVERVQTTSKKKLGGGKTTTKTYSYDKQWKNSLVDSQSFKQSSNHTNPSSMEFPSLEFDADPIMIGAYELPQELVGRIDWEEPLSADVNDIVDPSLRIRATKTADGFFVGSGSDSNPRVGDQRVRFAETPESIVTVVGVQAGGSLSAFVSETGAGGDVLLFRRGRHPAAALYDEAEADNAALAWILRFVGFCLMALGLYLVFRPIEVFADVVPCVGSVVGCGIVFVSVLVSAVLSAVTISIAWLVAHPKIGAIVLAVTLVIIGLCAFGVKKIEEMRNDDDGGGAEKAVDDALPTVYATPEGRADEA